MTTKHVVADDVLGRIARKQWELNRRLLEGSLDPAELDVGLQRLIEGGLSRTELLHGLYVPPEAQIVQFRRWNRELGLGFSEKQILDVLAVCPRDHKWTRTRPLTTTWTLDTLALSLKVKADILATIVNVYYVNPILYEEDAVRLTPQGGTEPPDFPAWQLSWSVDNLGANRDKAPRDCTEQRLSGVEVLDIAMQHPKALQAQTGKEMPHWNLGGIQVDADRDGSWGYVPCLSFSHDDQDFSLNIDRADDVTQGWSVPVREL